MSQNCCSILLIVTDHYITPKIRGEMSEKITANYSSPQTGVILYPLEGLFESWLRLQHKK